MNSVARNMDCTHALHDGRPIFLHFLDNLHLRGGRGYRAGHNGITDNLKWVEVR